MDEYVGDLLEVINQIHDNSEALIDKYGFQYVAQCMMTYTVRGLFEIGMSEKDFDEIMLTLKKLKQMEYI